MYSHVLTGLRKSSKKLSAPHDSVACRLTFCSNNLNCFLYDFTSLSRRYGGILAHYSLQHCSSSLIFMGICLCTALLRSYHSNSFRLKSGLLFWNSIADLLLCLGLLSCYMTQSGPCINCWTDGFTSHSRVLWNREEVIADSVTERRSSPVAAKQAGLITPPPPCLTLGMKCLC